MERKIFGPVVLTILWCTLALLIVPTLSHPSARPQKDQKISLLEDQIIPELNKVVFSSTETASQSLAETGEVRSQLTEKRKPDHPEVIIALETAKRILNAEFVYLMDRSGTVVASTSDHEGKNLTGNNYLFRRYFQGARKGNNVIYPALGVTTRQRGVYFSSPVYSAQKQAFIGVVVVKIPVKDLDRLFLRYEEPIFLLTPEGIVFATNRKETLYHYTTPLQPETMERIQAERQFADQPLKPFPAFLDKDTVVFDQQRYLVVRKDVIQGWSIIAFHRDNGLFEISRAAFFSILGVIFVLVVILILLLRHNLAIRKVEGALRKSQELFQSLFTLAPDGIVITSMEGEILAYNDSFLEIVKSDRTSIADHNIRDFYDNPDRDRPALITLLGTKKIIKSYPLTLKNSSGEVRKASVSTAFIDYQGKTCMESIYRDITDLENMEEQLRFAQKMEMIGTLAGGLAHDINNMLSGITGSLSLLRMHSDKERGVSKANFLKYLDIMEGASKNVAAMARQLLTLARENEPSLGSVDLNASVRQVLKICQYSLDKTISFETSYSKHPALVTADPVHIEQVLLNLCINAAHAMTIMKPEADTPGGILAISVERALHAPVHPAGDSGIQDRGFWLISVSDQGVGMSPDEIEKIFTPFYTTKQQGKGSGLGLSMVNNIIKRYQGVLEVSSTPGRGSTFKIYLPATELPPPEHHVEES